MTVKSKDLTIGQFYEFGIRRRAIPATHGDAERRGHAIPAQTDRYVGQLIDKRSNGRLVMQVDYQTWDYPAGWGGPGDLAHFMRGEKKAVTKTRLVEIKSPQIIRHVEATQPKRVPEPPKAGEMVEASMFEKAS